MSKESGSAPRCESLIGSPIGPLLLVASDEALTRIDFVPAGSTCGAEHRKRSPILALAKRELDEYFRGKLREFSVPLAPEGTAFQRDVWNALLALPYGATTSYGELAHRIGRPAAVRAVGAANGANPIPIVIPCHRVIGRDGSLTGYGGGIAIKQFLLRLEGVRVREVRDERQPALFDL